MSVNDNIYFQLEALGFKGQLNDKLFHYLGTLGHNQNTLQERIVAYGGWRELVGGPTGDPHWGNVVALLHMDTDFTDEAGKSWTPNNAYPIDHATYKFGGGSGYFNVSAFIEGPTSTDWAFGTGDFTVECWVYSIDMPVGLYYSPTGNWASSTGGCFFLRPSGVMSWHSAGSAYASASGVFTLNTWHHIAYSRQGGVGRLFVDGVQVASGPDTTNFTWTQAFRIGVNRTTSDYWRGYVDEVRITKGVARYTGNFTPPTEPFPNFGPSP